MRKFNDYASFAGKRFSHLTFLRFDHMAKRKSYVELLCDCGKTTVALWENVRRGMTKSCGCKQHRDTQYTKDPLYSTWRTIRARCTQPSCLMYSRYGGAGVKICPEWDNSFPAFRDWALANGWKPGLEVEKDIKGNSDLYSPETCIITTHAENMKATKRTKRIKSLIPQIKESPLSSRKLAKELNINPGLILRIRNGSYNQ